MIKIFIPLLISVSAQALEVQFVGPCSRTPVLKTHVEGDFANVGVLTIETLKKINVPFVGSEFGISAMFGTPTETRPSKFYLTMKCGPTDGATPSTALLLRSIRTKFQFQLLPRS